MSDVNVFSCVQVINVSGATGPVIAFGFPAQYVRIDNLGSVDLFLRPSQSCAAALPSTGEYAITSCAGSNRASWEYWAPPVSTRAPCADMTLGSIAVTTTSTTAGGQKIAVLAMG